MNAQINLLDEIIVDNFAGGGGASTGIELAMRRPVTVAINHDPDAILMHKTNHPYTEHLQASVWDINPVEVCAGRPVGLAWFSPDCKHFSKAKGGKPVEKKIRGLAWIALRWAGTVRPRVIILENVEEFQTWGPVKRGHPVKSKSGQTFRKFISQLEGLGYQVEHRELVAADYGAPTIRKRFFLIARCDGKPIVWPEPTHGAGRSKPWKSAAEIIDWSLPCPSIFSSRSEIKARYGLTAVRPLADNTMRRVIRGVDKFTIKSGKPFIVPSHDNEVSTPSMMAIGQTGGSDRTRSVESPIHTQVSKAETCLIAPSLIQYHSEQSENVRGQDLNGPIMTVDGSNRYGLAAAHLTEYYGNAQDGLNISGPMHTATAKDREGLTLAYISKFYKTSIGQELTEPLHTCTTSPGHFGVVYTTVVKATPGASLQYWPKIRDLLNQYCGYHLADNEVILLWIGETAYFIADIGLRMLTPRELYNAQGFPPDYIIDRDYLGNAYGKTKQVARCGNAVCPPLAESLVRANMADTSPVYIATMAQLNKLIAV